MEYYVIKIGPSVFLDCRFQIATGTQTIARWSETEIKTAWLAAIKMWPRAYIMDAL